jgi:nucleoside-diphosphate-sugar epimerase
MADGKDGPILVTGAAGCIGAWVIAELSRQGLRAVVLDASDDRRRLLLVMGRKMADAIAWVTGDITDMEAVDGTVARFEPRAIIHLAALQVPACRTDPVAGARVNVLGHVNIFEAARRRGVARIVYASSVAAQGPTPEEPSPHTLYGVYKRADEGVAAIYAADWGVASIGLRPHTVYGPGRDQGLTSAPTKAMLAAAAGRPFTIPFTGELRMQYAGEVAEAFVRAAVSNIDPAESGVYDLAGERASLAEIAAIINRLAPGADIQVEGDSLPFPTDQSDRQLRRAIGDWRAVGLGEGTELTIQAFRRLLAEGALDPASVR